MYNDDNIKTIDNKIFNNKIFDEKIIDNKPVNDKIVDKNTIDDKISIKKNNKIISKTIKLIPSLICNGKCNKCKDISNCF